MSGEEQSNRSEDQRAERAEHRDEDERATDLNEKLAVNQGNNIYVSNLDPSTTDEDLRAYFAAYGDMQHCQIVREPLSNVSRGFAFLAYSNVENSERAISELHGSQLDGRKIKVEKAKRGGGYQKTPGRYLGPRLVNAVRGDDRRGGGYGGGGGYDDRERDRDYGRARSDDYDYRREPPRGPPSYERGPPSYDRREGGGYEGGGRYNEYDRRGGGGGYAYESGGYDRRGPPARDDRRDFRRDDFREPQGARKSEYRRDDRGPDNRGGGDRY